VNKDDIQDGAVDKAIKDLKSEITRRLKQKGNSIFTSYHEILGIIEEEKHELVEAVIQNDVESIRSELMDIAVACVFGAACVDHWLNTGYKGYKR
jgi:NTP pyrophosphatase (non-canonical NTP hydrolase)